MITGKVICIFCFEKIIVSASFEGINFFRSEEIQGASQNFYPTKKGGSQFFLLNQIWKASITLIILGVGHVFFSKMTKVGPGELKYMLMEIPAPFPPKK